MIVTFLMTAFLMAIVALASVIYYVNSSEITWKKTGQLLLVLILSLSIAWAFVYSALRLDIDRRTEEFWANQGKVPPCSQEEVCLP